MRAQEYRDSAVEHIKKAITELSEIVVKQVRGWDEFPMDYRIKLDNAFHDLINIKNSIE